MNRVWTNTDRQFIRDNAGVLSDEIGAIQLSGITGRKISIHSYRKQRQLMGVKKKHGRGVCGVVVAESVVVESGQ